MIDNYKIRKQNEMTQCPECGTDVSNTQEFCMECGTALEQTQSESSTGETVQQGEYVTAKRVGKVESILDEDETVHYLTRGSTVDVQGSSAGSSLFGDDRSRKTGTRGWVRAAITDKRVAVKIPQWLGSDERSVPYDSITSVDLDTGLVKKRISLQTAGQTYHIEVDNPGKEECREAVRFIRNKISESKQPQVITQDSSDPDPTEQLKNIKELHEQGVLSDEEFKEKKQSLLDKI